MPFHSQDKIVENVARLADMQARMDALRMSNTALRDRNDELVRRCSSSGGASELVRISDAAPIRWLAAEQIGVITWTPSANSVNHTLSSVPSDGAGDNLPMRGRSCSIR